MNLCVTISDKKMSTIISQLEKFEYGEIRLDKTGYSDEFLKEVFSLDKKLIATIRPCGISNELRMEILKKSIQYGAQFIDIEIETPKAFINDIVSYAKIKDCKVIISYHNYKFTDDFESLSNIIIHAKEYEADIVKIATHINNTSDLKTIYKLYSEFDNIIAIGMGELGKITRLNSIFNGAPFTYVYQNNIRYRMGEGQMKYQQVLNILKLMDH